MVAASVTTKDQPRWHNLEASKPAILEVIACEFGFMLLPAFASVRRARRLDQLATPKSQERLMSHPITCLKNRLFRKIRG